MHVQLAQPADLLFEIPFISVPIAAPPSSYPVNKERTLWVRIVGIIIFVTHLVYLSYHSI